LTARPSGEAGLVKSGRIMVGSVVFAAAWTSATHGPFAAPAVAKQAPALVPQKQRDASPPTVQWPAITLPG